jgi:nucleotide sugar dehydrogenase
VSGTCFAETGVDVTCVDVDQRKIEMLNNGQIPIYEPGLEDIFKRNVEKGRLQFSVDLAQSLENTDVVFIAVGTPPDEDGSADLKYVLSVAAEIGRNIDHYMVVVTKSTVPVGTSVKIKNAIHAELEKRGVDIGECCAGFFAPRPDCNRNGIGKSADDDEAVVQTIFVERASHSFYGHYIVGNDQICRQLDAGHPN